MRVVSAALISGGMYDALYAGITDFTRETGAHVDVAFRAPHPELNAHLAGFEQPPYDLVSTHTKYAPSQIRFLAPLELITAVENAGDFYPAVIDLATIRGQLYGIPRNVDVKLLHYRTDLLPRAPATWDELRDLARAVNRPPDPWGFVFTGRDSGLFGMFYELAESAGARLFPESLAPKLRTDPCRWALKFLTELYRDGLVPPALPEWHYDEVHAFFRSGKCAMVCDWPGYYGAYLDPILSSIAGRFSVARLPASPAGKSLAYGGCHTFALTKAGAQKPEAVELLRFLTSPERQLSEAERGSVPVRGSVMACILQRASGPAAERLSILDDVIRRHVLFPPKLSFFPDIEDILWRLVQAAITGRQSVDESLEEMEKRISQCARRHAG